MKQLFIVLTAVILTASVYLPQQASAQAPQKLSYQAVIRNSTSQLVTNTKIGMKISILQGSATGTSVYTETQTPTTNANGLVNVEIGGLTGFDLINWGSNSYYLKSETDPLGGTNYTIVGTTQLLSTPYALYATKAGNGFSGSYVDLTNKPTLSTVAASGSYADLLNKPTLFSGVYADLTSKPTFATVATTGGYADLLNKPVLFSGSYVDLTNKPTFATIATSGSYTDLLNKPLLVYTATAPASGSMLYYNGTAWSLLNKGTDAQVLKLETGMPKWKNLSDYGSVIPAAIFNVSQLLGTTVQSISVDASAVLDDVDAPTTLQVRWKWEDTGTFTAWTTTKTATNTYTTEGAKNITLEVKDSQGNVGTSSKAIVINNTIFSPMVSTTLASNITSSSVTCGGSVIANGASNITAYGVCWATTQNPTIANSKTTDGTGLGSFISNVTGLAAGTTYYVRAYATNSTTTSYGNQVTVATPITVLFPTVTTTAASNITATSAATGGNVTATGGATVTERGICWSSSNQNPTIADSHTSDGTGTGTYPSQISGITPGVYYAKAYATNSAGTGYGSMITITTPKTIPVLSTNSISEISAMGGVSGGKITSNGGGTLSERGIVWGESSNPTIADKKIISPATTASFSSAIITAKPSTTYYIRAYATNEIGTSYGDEKTFTSSAAHYFTSYESGMTPSGWSGSFTVTSTKAFDGSYSFMSLTGVDNDETFTTTLTTPGQLSFYYSFYVDVSSYLPCIDIYIDNVKVAYFGADAASGNTYTTWRQGLVPLSAGTHTIKWHFFNNSSAFNCRTYIDNIIITK